MTKDSVAQDIRSSIVGGNARSNLAANTQYAQVMSGNVSAALENLTLDGDTPGLDKTQEKLLKQMLDKLAKIAESDKDTSKERKEIRIYLAKLTASAEVRVEKLEKELVVKETEIVTAEEKLQKEIEERKLTEEEIKLKQEEIEKIKEEKKTLEEEKNKQTKIAEEARKLDPGKEKKRLGAKENIQNMLKSDIQRIFPGLSMQQEEGESFGGMLKRQGKSLLSPSGIFEGLFGKAQDTKSPEATFDQMVESQKQGARIRDLTAESTPGEAATVEPTVGTADTPSEGLTPAEKEHLSKNLGFDEATIAKIEREKKSKSSAAGSTEGQLSLFQPGIDTTSVNTNLQSDINNIQQITDKNQMDMFSTTKLSSILDNTVAEGKLEMVSPETGEPGTIQAKIEEQVEILRTIADTLIGSKTTEEKQLDMFESQTELLETQTNIEKERDAEADREQAYDSAKEEGVATAKTESVIPEKIASATPVEAKLESAADAGKTDSPAGESGGAGGMIGGLAKKFLSRKLGGLVKGGKLGKMGGMLFKGLGMAGKLGALGPVGGIASLAGGMMPGLLGGAASLAGGLMGSGGDASVGGLVDDVGGSPVSAPSVPGKAGKGIAGVGKKILGGAGSMLSKGLGMGKGLLSKGLGKGLMKGAGKSLLKKIPGIGLVAGLGFGASRLMSGDWKGALGEVASGAAGTIPGIGTAASAAIDAGLAVRDSSATPGVEAAANTGQALEGMTENAAPPSAPPAPVIPASVTNNISSPGGAGPTTNAAPASLRHTENSFIRFQDKRVSRVA